MALKMRICRSAEFTVYYITAMTVHYTDIFNLTLKSDSASEILLNIYPNMYFSILVHFYNIIG